MYKIIKRVLDICISLLALPILVVIIFIIGVAIKLDDGGPIFYKAKRIGKGCKIFNMYKFRSMVVNAPNWTNKDGSSYNAADDERVTKVGKFIRKTSIDELPQIINILIGDMSLIGPRASGALALDNYLEDEKKKMDIKPGLTGFTQAYFRNDLTVREKRLKDVWYVENMSFWLDVKIFIKTIETVLKHENIYTNSSNVRKNELWIDTEKEHIKSDGAS